MECDRPVGKSWQSRWQSTRAAEDSGCYFAALRPRIVRLNALLQYLQNVIGCRKVTTVTGNPVKLRHAAIAHSLIQIHLTASR